MQDSNSKSLEKVLAQQRKKEIAADDYHSKIENWLRLADQMLGTTGDRLQGTGDSRKNLWPRINPNERESEKRRS